MLIFSAANLMQMKKQVKSHLNSLFKIVNQLSVAEFHFVKPGLIKHVCWCEWGISFSCTSGRCIITVCESPENRPKGFAIMALVNIVAEYLN